MQHRKSKFVTAPYVRSPQGGRTINMVKDASCEPPGKRTVCNDSQSGGHAGNSNSNRRVREKGSAPPGPLRGGGAGVAAGKEGMGEATGGGEGFTSRRS